MPKYSGRPVPLSRSCRSIAGRPAAEAGRRRTTKPPRAGFLDKLVSHHYLGLMTPTAQRMTASERREMVIEAALAEFAARGLDGTSTEDVARRAGISHPYLFRLFPTKKALFLALVEQCFGRVEDAFTTAAGDRV